MTYIEALAQSLAEAVLGYDHDPEMSWTYVKMIAEEVMEKINEKRRL
jgi:hypothetical protein